MKENVCNNYKIVLKEGSDYEKLLKSTLLLFDKIYSVFINKTYSEGKFVAYTVCITQFFEDRYNTIPVDECLINEMLYAIMTSTENYRIYFKQPSLDIMYEVYYNYTCKLAADVVKKFPEYEYDDVVQICALAICNLYHKGYYLNKKLIKTALLHEMYMLHRKTHGRQCVDVSFFANLEKKDCATEWFNNFEDKDANRKREDDEYNDVIHSIMNILKPIIQDRIGERRLKKLLDNFSAGSMSKFSQPDIRAIRKMLNKLGYDVEWFRRQFE